MLEVDNTRIQLTVEEMEGYLSKSYSRLINNNVPLKNFPSVMLWGPPGVGKSQGIRQVANEIEDNTGKMVVVTDVRLLLFNPVDLRGIPTSNEDKTLAVWLKPKIFQMDESADVVNILFLDEISAAPQSVQAAAYQITLDRVIGEHKLPENCIVIAAGNRVTDKSVAYREPENEYDEWAVAVYLTEDDKIGFISRFKNETIARLMDAGKKFVAITDDPSEVEDIDEHGRRKGAPTENMAIPVSIYLVEQE